MRLLQPPNTLCIWFFDPLAAALVQKFRPSYALALGPGFCPARLGSLQCVVLTSGEGAVPKVCVSGALLHQVCSLSLPARPEAALRIQHLTPESHVLLGSQGDLLLFIPPQTLPPCRRPGNLLLSSLGSLDLATLTEPWEPFK